MKIKAIGKQHMEGISKKTGNPYCFNSVFFIGREDDRVIGQHGCSINLDPDLYPFNDIQIGCEYEVEYGPRNRIVGFKPVK